MTEFLSDVDRKEEEQRLIRQMLDRAGHKQVSLAHETALTAPWLVDASFTQKLVNWKDAYELIPLNRLPKDANYIRSHAFCHFKRSISDDSNDSLRLKTRIVKCCSRKLALSGPTLQSTRGSSVFIDFGHCLQWPRHTHAT
jgi:hypothetical protein